MDWAWEDEEGTAKQLIKRKKGAIQSSKSRQRRERQGKYDTITRE
jgi:hypothetical protein